MNDRNMITGEEILRERLMVDERFHEDADRSSRESVDRSHSPARRRRYSTSELLEALGYEPTNVLPDDSDRFSDEDEQAWEDAWQSEFGAADATARARADIARVGLAEALQERVPRRRRRYTPDQVRDFLRG
jgi:hypothetical protein